MRVLSELSVSFTKWRVLTAVMALLTVALTSPLCAATIFVATDGNNSDGSTWTTAYTTIQAGVDAATSGDEVWVKAGTYRGTGDNVVEMKNGVHLYGGFDGTETDRNDRNWTTNLTIIDGEGEAGNRRGVFADGVDDGTLDGFTITNCIASRDNGDNYNGGGMYIYNSSPTVINCNFTNNLADYLGGGMCTNYNSSPTVNNCTFTGNSAFDGGGMENVNSSPMVSNCTFTKNSAFDGGGMENRGSSPTVSNCTFTDNSAGSGGGMYNNDSSTVVSNCTFRKNSGMYNRNSSAKITNCTFVKNSGMTNLSSSPTVTNCILWGNGREIGNYQSSVPIVTYSCVKSDEVYQGEGNINTDPLFWNAMADDVRLHSTSPCIDTGTVGEGIPSEDSRGISRPQGGGVDMGTNEMNEVDTDGDDLYDDFEIEVSRTDPNKADTFEDDEIGNDWDWWFQPNLIARVDASSVATIPDGESWETAFPDINTAIDWLYARGGGEVWIKTGTYNGMGTNVVEMADAVHLYGGFAGSESSRDERDWNANVTIINGEDERRCVYATGVIIGTLDGFTVTGGNSTRDGGGMYNLSSSPVVTNCNFASNSASYGGGIYNGRSSPVVTICNFADNSAYYGGGIYNTSSSSPTMTNCTFTDNSADDEGGGICNIASTSTVTNCIFMGNSTGYTGGGIYNRASSPTVSNCIFTENSADFRGGGIYNDDSSPAVTNCIFEDNSADHDGGGMSNSGSSPMVTNCTFTANSVNEHGGGMYNNYYSSTTVTNCILWSNGEEIYDYTASSSSVVSYSCVEGGYENGTNMVTETLASPFVDAESGNFQLISGSACINSGTTIGAPTTDILGVTRPQGSGIDLGAYEFVEHTGIVPGTGFMLK